MEHVDHASRPTGSAGRDPRQGESAKLPDAVGTVERDIEDEAAANAARERLRTSPLAALQPDRRISPFLLPDECVLAVRPSAVLERRQPAAGARTTSGVDGTLYVTSRRLVLVGRTLLSFGLDAVREILLSGDRLLLLLGDGQGIALVVPQPRLLRVELMAARTMASADPSARAAHHPELR